MQIYLVFELDHYYQNYRRYVRSYDPKEMHDNGSSIPGQSACAPYQWVGNAENDSLPESGAIVPCGQISHSLFNDTFTLSVGGAPVAINVSGTVQCSIHGLSASAAVGSFLLRLGERG